MGIVLALCFLPHDEVSYPQCFFAAIPPLDIHSLFFISIIRIFWHIGVGLQKVVFRNASPIFYPFGRSPKCWLLHPPLFFPIRRYAALDAYACLLLHGRIGELSDSIFRDAEELHVGDRVRFNTLAGNDCVGEGYIVEHTDETWGTTGFYVVPRRATRGFGRRWAVHLDRVNVPRAKALYPDATDRRGAPATAQLASRVDSVILWDASRVRKMTATPSAGAAGTPAGAPVVAPAGEVARAPAEEAATSSEHVEASTVSCERSGPRATNGGGKEGPRLSDCVGMAEAANGAGQGGAEFVTPSEPFFAGELDGIEALSSESVAYSAGLGGLADEGQAAKAGGDSAGVGGLTDEGQATAGGGDDEEDEVLLDVTADMFSA